MTENEWPDLSAKWVVIWVLIVVGIIWYLFKPNKK